MLREPVAGIVTYADIERSVTAACEEINIVSGWCVHCWRDASKTCLTAVVMGPGLRRDDSLCDWECARHNIYGLSEILRTTCPLSPSINLRSPASPTSPGRCRACIKPPVD